MASNPSDKTGALEIGRRIARFREAKGLSQKELGFALNVSDGRISKWERGEHKISGDYLKLVAAALGVSRDALDPPQSHVVRETPATYNAFLETPLGESLPEELRERLLSHDFAVPPSVQTWASLASDLIAARKGKAIESPELEIKPREGTAYRVRPAKKK